MRKLVKEPNKSIHIKSDILYKSLASVYRAASKDTSRSHMCTVLLRADSNEITTVTTNGHTLAVYKDKVKKVNCDKVELLLPIHDVKELIKKLKPIRKVNKDSVIEIIKNKSEIKFINSIFEHSFTLSSEVFPPYEKVIPRDNRATNLEEGCFGIRGEYLKLVYDCFKELDETNLRVVIGNTLDPIIFLGLMESKLKVVIMPVRV